MRGVLLDPVSGRREQPTLLGPSGLPVHVEENLRNGWSQPKYDGINADFSKLPQHILDNLERAGRADFSKASPWLNSGQGWETCEGVIITDGATITTAAANQTLVPDMLLAIPRPGQHSPGITYRFTLWGSLSLAATPGTFQHFLKWGGGGGVALATSATITPTNTGAVTTASWSLEYVVTIRTEPTTITATAWCQGRFECPGILLPAATSTQVVTYLQGCQIPATGAAISASIDVSVAKALSPVYTPSLTTASCVAHLGYVESLN